MLKRRSEIGIGLHALKLSHIRLLAEIRSTGRLGLAAEKIGVAQPAASRLLSEIEAIIGHPIHERDGRSLKLTAAGEALAHRASRIQLELRDAGREIAEAVSGVVGHVRVGSVTGPSLSHLLPVLRRLREDSPGVTVEVVVATSDDLCGQVLDGKLDFALGRVPASLQDQMAQRGIGREPLELVVRRNHPLLAKADLRFEDLMGYDWVMSGDQTLLAQTVRRWFSNAGHPLNRQWVSTSSFLFALAMLKETDAIAPLASSVATSFAAGESMPFARVPIALNIAVEAYSSFHRRDAILPPAATRVLDSIHALSETGGS